MSHWSNRAQHCLFLPLVVASQIGPAATPGGDKTPETAPNVRLFRNKSRIARLRNCTKTKKKHHEQRVSVTQYGTILIPTFSLSARKTSKFCQTLSWTQITHQEVFETFRRTMPGAGSSMFLPKTFSGQSQVGFFFAPQQTGSKTWRRSRWRTPLRYAKKTTPGLWRVVAPALAMAPATCTSHHAGSVGGRLARDGSICFSRLCVLLVAGRGALCVVVSMVPRRLVPSRPPIRCCAPLCRRLSCSRWSCWNV